jgi:hypothetical protein
MVVATPDAAAAAAAHARPRTIGVRLFSRGTERLPGLGATLPDRVRDLPGPLSTVGWDFLTIASAVFAADRFVIRAGSADGWTRSIGLRVSVADPAPWLGQVNALSSALRFLTGDVWHLEIVGGGMPPPDVRAKPHDYDAVCLFSGGLDSFLGALHLRGSGAKPLLVSQGSPKEISPQRILEAGLGLQGHRFEARIRERWRRPYEPSTRARSLLFYGYGVVAAIACGLDTVVVPENALIAINPPLTRRRIGSLSTRTVHPHLLKTLNDVLADAGVGIGIENPFYATTKGEMLALAHHPRLSELASQSYSCGKGKRGNGQCGRCVPCLIRRASFDAAGVDDGTRYLNELEHSARNDDVLAARQGAARIARMDRRALERWVMQSGPLPKDAAIRDATVEAVGRGLVELRDLFGQVRWR